MTPRTGTMWEVNAHHPDKAEPYDFFCRFYHTQKDAEAKRAELTNDGWEHIHIIPPAHLRLTQRGNGDG